ncbi:hypothetical protein D5125_05505 [Magnetovirga frankeli]|uniref:beta strand repeat-containing protein n=1 Tax=Magnetovirga frankeli TaxID=947516 RepID=UPI001293DD02|nr:hypothetical protein D5125_05505 [gamma proteobacterium SS-5]
MALTTNQLVYGIMGMAVGGYKTVVEDYVTANGTDAAAAALLTKTDINPQAPLGGDLYDNDTFAAKLVASMFPELDDADQAALATSVVTYMTNNGLSRGAVAVDLIEALDSIESTHSVFGASAARFDAAVAAADAYEGDATDINTLQDIVGTTGSDRGQNFTLQPTPDVIKGGSGSDTIFGVVDDAVAAQNTLTAADEIDGGAGNDLMTVLLRSDYDGGATIENVETLQIGSNDAAVRAFDYNVNLGAYEVTGVETVVYDQINNGEQLTVNNITPSAEGGVAPALKWDNEAGSRAGTIAATFREATVTGTTNLSVILDDVNAMNAGDGIMNIGGGVETVTITSQSQGTTTNTLNNSGNADTGSNAVGADIISAGSLTKVVLLGSQEIGKAAGVVTDTTGARAAFLGRTDRAVNNDMGLTADSTNNATESNLLSVGSRVTEVDASGMTASANVRFVAKNDGSATNVTVTGGSANDYVEFELGNINADGGAGDDTFAFINNQGNSTFGEGDSIDGGEGDDTIQLGLNGIGTYNISETELRNKTSIGTLDLRGNATNLTLSSDFVANADTANSIAIRTDKIIQSSADNAANPTDGPTNNLEDASTHTIDMTMLSSNQAVNFMGGSGSDRIILDDASFNILKTLDGGSREDQIIPAGADRYDTLTLTTNGENVVIDSQDLSNVSNFEGMILTKNSATAVYDITLTQTFVNNNTESSNSGNTGINDTIFQIGTTNAANQSALSAGDTVEIDVSDLLNATDTGRAAGFTTRTIDITSLENAGVIVTFTGNTGALTAAAVRLTGVLVANGADGNFADVTRQSGAKVDPNVVVLDTTTGVDGIDLNVLGRDVEVSQTTLQAFDTIIGTGATTNNDMNFNGAVTTLMIDSSAGQPFANVTNLNAINLDDEVNSVYITDDGMFAATGLNISGGGKTDSFVTIGANINGFSTTGTISGGGKTDSLTVNAVTTGHNLGQLVADVETITLNGAATEDLSAQFGGGASAIVVGATTTSLTVNNSGTAMAGVNLSANVPATVTITNDDDVVFAAAAFDGGLTNLTVDVSGDTTGASVDFSAVTSLVAPSTTVTLGAANGVADNVDINAVSTVTNIGNIVTIENFEAGAGLDTITTSVAGPLNDAFIVTLASTTEANFVADVNTAVSGLAFTTDAATDNDFVVVTVSGGAMAGTYVVIDSDGSDSVNAGDEAIMVVGMTGTLTGADFA